MKRSMTRGELWLGLICAVAILGLGGLGLLRLRLDAEPDWGIPEAKPAPQPNGLDLYLVAKAAIIPARPPVDPVDEGVHVTDPAIIATRYSLARRMVWMKQNARAWALFEQARAADSLYPQDRSGISPGFLGDAALRELGRCKMMVANTAKMRGDWNGAAEAGLDDVEMGVDMTRGAPLIGYLTGSSVQAMGAKSCSDVSAHLSGPEARAAARRLEKLLADRPTMADTMREEKWCGLAQLRHIFRGLPWRGAAMWHGQVTPGTALDGQFLSKRQIVHNYNRGADWYVALGQRPYSPTPGNPPEADNFVNSVVNLKYPQLKFNFARDDTRLFLLHLRLALRAYRVEKGAYPATLSALAPTYLNKIPVDPFGNRTPLRYLRKGDSYLLWSVGPDGKDDGGKPIPPRAGRKIAEIIKGEVGDVIALPEAQ